MFLTSRAVQTKDFTLIYSTVVVFVKKVFLWAMNNIYVFLCTVFFALDSNSFLVF